MLNDKLKLSQINKIGPILMSSTNFNADFNSTSGQEWLVSVKKVLKEKEYKILTTETLDQIKIEPLYADNLQINPITGREQGMPWHIVQRIDSGTPSSINQEIKAAKLGGCNYFDFVLPDAPNAYSRGVRFNHIDDIFQLVEGIDISKLVLRITGGLNALPITASLCHYANKIGTRTDNLALEQSFDLTLSKYGYISEDEAVNRVKHLKGQWNWLGTFSNWFKYVTVDARIWHNAGANNVTELALCISQFVESLRLVKDNEIDPEDMLDKISVSLSAGVNQFENIAKFRAIRVLLANVIEHCEFESRHIPVNAESSWRMMSIHDPWVNLLRTTIACFSAGIGGADSISILPFSYVLGNNALANRLTRNTQKILLEESNLAVVSDPAAGSGIIEELTQQYCEQAWKMFQEIEQLGGLFKANESGFVNDVIKNSEQQRLQEIETGLHKITGVNSFPNISEDVPDTEIVTEPIIGELDPNFHNISDYAYDWFEKISEKIAETEIIPTNIESISPPPIERQIKGSRLSTPFEKLRAQAEKLEANGNRPEIFVAGLGSPAQFTKSATYAKSFFESAGIAVTGNHTTKNQSELVDLVKSSKCKLLCLCSDEPGLQELGTKLASALETTEFSKVYVVSSNSDSLKNVLDFPQLEFIYQGCNMVTTLNDALATFHQSDN